MAKDGTGNVAKDQTQPFCPGRKAGWEDTEAMRQRGLPRKIENTEIEREGDGERKRERERGRERGRDER